MNDFNFEEYAKSMAISVDDTLFDRINNTDNAEEKEQLIDWLESRGVIAPEENNVFTEAGEALAQSIAQGAKNWGKTLEEAGFGSGLKDYFQDVLDRNQQWNESENQGLATKIARTLGSAAGTSGTALAAGAIGTALGGAPVGTAAAFATMFGQTFGDNVQRNRAAGYDNDSAVGMAFLESGVDSLIESMPWGIIGKGGKIALNMNRLRKISGAGKKALLNKITERMVSQIGRDATENLIVKWGKQAALEGLGESGEEGLQYLNSYVNRVIGGDPNAEFSIDELADSMAQGFIGGFGLGLGQQAPSVIAEANRRRKFRKLGETPQPSATPSTSAETDSVSAPETAPATVPAQTPAPVQQIADGDYYTPLTPEEKEAVARLDAIETEEGINSEAERLGIKVDPSMTEQGKYNAVRIETIRQIRAAEAESAATVQTPVTPSNTAVEADPEIETEGQGTLDLAPAETAPVPAPAVPAVDIPDAPSPIDIAQTEINTQTVENQQIRADEEAEALANEIESEIRRQEEEDEIFDDYESGNYSDNQLAYAPESKVNITTPSTAELDAEKKISALKKAESDLNSMRERVAEQQGTAPESMESVKISEFDQSKIADKAMQRNLKLAQRIFDALGMGKVVTVETSKKGTFYGVTIRRDNAADNYAFLNMSEIKDNQKLLFHTAMHELVHGLVKNNTKAYETFRDKIILEIKGESWFESKLKKYAENRGFDLSIPAHKTACEEEFVCDTVADLMQTEMFWQMLAEKDLPLYKKILEALKDVLAKFEKSVGKVPDKVSAETIRKLKDEIELAQKFITEASGKSKEDLLSAVMPEETTQVASAENAQTTETATGKKNLTTETGNDLKPYKELQKAGYEAAKVNITDNLEDAKKAKVKAEKADPDYEYAISADKIDGGTLYGFFKKKKSTTAPSDQSDQTTEKNSTPSEPQAKETSEQVGEQVASKPSKSKTESKEQKPEVQSATDKITSSPAGSNTRIMAFTELADGEHTVNGKTFTKSGSAFTLDGKTLNAKEIEKATRTLTEKIKAKPKAEEKPSDVSDKSEKIEDYGEKIGGAKKDRYTDTIREKIVGNYTDEEIFGLSVDKLFPKLDYEKLAADGMKKSSIAILKAARETLPHKPSDKWKYKKNGYISAVRQTLEVAQAVLDGKMDLETLQKRVNDAYSELADLDRQLEEKKNKFPDGATVTQAEYNQNEKEIFDIYSKKSDVYDRSRLDMKLIDAARAIELINIPMSDYRFDYEILSNATYRNGKQDYNYRSYRINRSIYSLTSRLNDEHSIKDVARVIEEDLKKRAESGKGKSTEKSTLPRTITIIAHAVSENNKRKLVYEIVSDTGRKGITLKDGFETAQAAAEFFKSEDGKAELEKRWAEFKDIKHYNPQESPRQGKDYRNGRNITAQELAETFGFRGVEFGNWADQNNRQKRLNETYDALMDMAAILDISPRAVGLGGKLGMAFGSRGSGGANAHFESDAFVINITKTRGAGSLAHEWLHALDNYFARQSESQHGMATDMHELNLKNMRDELKEKWMGLRRTLEMSAMKRRSNKHSDYWSRIWEVAARAFSRYIQDKAIANNMSNDYLVSLFPEELLTEIQRETTPYALTEDMETITPAFDAFFEALQEKVDESGNTALFSTAGDKKQSIEEINQNFNDDLDRQIAGTLPKGYIHQLGTPGDILLSTGVPNLPIELSATRLEEKSKQENHPFNIADLKNLPKMLQKPIGVFSYGNKDNAQNIIIEVQQNGRNYLVGLSFNFEHDGLIVNSIRGLFAKETAFWLRWIEQGKTLYINKEKVQNLIAQQRTNLADVNNLDLNSINNIIQNFENPSISEKNPENYSISPITEEEITNLQNNEDTASEIVNNSVFSLVTDQKLIDKLDSEEEAGDYITLYRSVQIAPDGTLHSPMAGKINGKWGSEIVLGEWEQADERPDMAILKKTKSGKLKFQFKLDKGNGKSIWAAYNPYLHSSSTMLNDQFSSAYTRPELVTIEVRVPKSELTSNYKAEKAKDHVGMMKWKAGVVQGKLSGKREVMLSRWDKPIRIVPDSEVAQHIKEMLDGKDITIPANVVTPSLRSELEKLGVKIDYSVKEYNADKEISSTDSAFSIPSDRADMQGENLVVVHNTSASKLRNALKLGGMPVPSMAVIDAEKSDFSNFGEITLVADKSVIDPKDKKNKVYNADIYSPRSPQIVYEYGEKDYDRAFEKIKPYETREADDRDSIDKLVYYHKNGMTDRDFAEDLKKLPAVRVWFNRTNTNGQDFDTWWEDTALPELNFSQNGKIFNGYTASGRRKWIPATLENVVKLMTKKIRNGEGFNYGVGNIRSMVAKQFKSIADIKKNRESIVSEETFKAVKKDIQNEFRELEEEMRQSSVGGRYGWSFDTASDCLMAMAEGGRENMQYLKDRFGDDKEILGKMAEFLKKLENLPTEYFEAKPQRAVSLNEFKAAVIPENTPADIKKSLEDAGVEVFTYKNDSERKAVLQNATKDNDIRFSLTTDLGDTSLSPMDYRRSIDPLFDFVMEYTDNGIVNPGKEHEGEYFTGSFISREYIAYSEKKPQGKKQSDKQYQQYLERRKQALDNAEGTPLDEIAAAYVRKFGGDEKEIAEQILDMLRDLTKRDLISDRAEAKREVAEHEKEQRKEDDAEWKKMKEDSLTEKVNDLFESEEKPVVDKRWVQMHREIYPKLYKTVFPNAEKVPDIPSSREMAIINQALANGKMDEAAKVAEPLLTDKNLEVKEEADNIEKSIIMRVIELISPKLANSLRDPNEKKDINLVDMLLRPPKWIAEKLKDLPAVQALYQATQDFLDDKAKIANYLNDGLIDKLVNLQKEDKAEYKKCNDYLLKSDRDQTGAGRVKGDKEGLFYIATTADGVSIGSFKTEDEAFEELFKNEHDEIIAKGIMSEKAADAALEFRRAMRRTFVFRRDTTFRTLRQLGLIDVDSTSFIIENAQAYFPDTDITGRVDLFELMREMGQRSGYYVPRIRHGRYMFKATKAGEPTILKGFDTKIGRARERSKLEKQGYKVENFLSNTPDQSMMQQVDPAAMMDIMNQAQIRADEKLKNDLTFKEEIYTRKDGTKEKHLVLSPKAELSTQTVIMLKSIGAKYIDDSWHIINADLQTKANIEEILKGQALHESKLQIAMQSALGASLVDMLRETGAGSSKIQRRTAKGDDVVRGYEEDLIKISGLYINGVSGSTAKNIMAKKMYSAFGGMCFDREKYIADLIPEGLEIGTAEYEKARLNATAEYYKEVQRLAINSAKQPQLAKYFDGYIKEMLRNTTGLERILGGVKGVSAIWLLTRPSSAISNLVTAVATTPATVHAKTGCGIGFAIKQTGIGAKLYTQYFNWGKYGEGTNLPPQTRELFDIIHKNGWDGAELTKSATQAGLTFAGKTWSKTAYGALWMFSHAEQVNRAAAVYAAYKALVKQRNIDESKLSAMDKYRLLKEAKNISDFGNGVYNKGNRLAITRGGGWGAVVDTGLLFKTFSVNLYNNMYNMLVTGNIKSLAYMTTVLMLAGGASSSIIGTLLASMLGAFSADEGEEKDEAFYRIMGDNVNQRFANILKYGIPAAMNINLSGTFRDDIVDAMHDGLPDGNINFTELPAFAIYRNMKNAIEYADSGQSMKTVEQLLPSWFASMARAVREANDGVTDRQGKKRKDIHDEYIEADGWDTVARVLSFNPVAVSEKTDRIWSEKKVREKYSQMRKDIVEDYRAIIFDGNPSNEELADIAKRIEEYNAKARRSKRNLPFIDGSTLKKALESKDNKFFKDDLDEKDKKRIEKKAKGRIVIRNGKLVKE